MQETRVLYILTRMPMIFKAATPSIHLILELSDDFFILIWVEGVAASRIIGCVVQDHIQYQIIINVGWLNAICQTAASVFFV